MEEGGFSSCESICCSLRHQMNRLPLMVNICLFQKDELRETWAVWG